MNELPRIVESHATIRFQDCDPFNHLNNANYINYLTNAREDQILAHYDLDVFKMARADGKSWVVASNQIAYLKPAMTMEKVLIDSQLIHFTKNELHVELRMWNNEKTKLKAVMWSTYVHFDLLKQRRCDHTQELDALFTNIKLEVPENSFEKRMESFKSKAIIK